MNVIVYAGPEVVQASLSRVIHILKPMLAPNYTVQTLSSQGIGTHPWMPNCALLVFPECHHFHLSPPTASTKIRTFVEQGGRVLTLAAGIRRSTQTPTDGTLYFQNSEQGASEYLLPVSRPAKARSVQYIRHEGTNLDILAILRSDATIDPLRTADQALGSRESGSDVIGAVVKANSGKLAAWLLSLEQPFQEQIPTDCALTSDKIEAADMMRDTLLRKTLAGLDIQVPVPLKETRDIARPTPQFLVAHPTLSGATRQIVKALDLSPSADGPDNHATFEDANDVFWYRTYSSAMHNEIGQLAIYPSGDPSSWQPKHVLVCSDGTLPPRSATPMFDLASYFNALRPEERSAVDVAPWAIGEALYYGEIVTSTQTMLDKYE
jgi:biotin---protein ligase